MRIILRLGRKDDHHPSDLFCNCLLQRRNSGFGLLLSCGLHCAAAVALTVAGAWSHPLREPWPPPGYEVQYLRVVVPEPFYFFPSKNGATAVRANRNTTARVAPVNGTRLARPSPPRSGNMGVMRIPRVQAAAWSRMVLVQPELQINVPPNIKLPEVFAWSRHRTGVPATLIVPGHSESGAGRPAAEPSLTAANSQERVGRVNVAPAPAPIPAKLSLSPQATTPISFPSEAGAESDRRISVDTLDADPVNLLSSSAQRPKPGEQVRIPSGTAVPSGIAGANPAASGASGQPGKQGSRESRTPAASVTAPARAMPGASGIHTVVLQEGSQAATEDQPRAPSAGAIPVAATAAPPGLEEADHSGRASPGAPIRKVHPKNGNFDVVVMQAPRAGSTREGKAVLNGSQVYTVYLEVGTERPWVLQFCKPADAGAAHVRGGVLQLSAEAGIQAPYPVVTVVPPPGSTFTAAKLYVRGILNREGRFNQLAMVGKTGAASRQILSLLEQWQFRPAMESGIPVPVEVLLAIPPPEARDKPRPSGRGRIARTP
ncbi:MAG: hypothetical protein M1608_03670 [Candidatus Omnitrophica bacterium]|nr:hypothetical protein [Candidatus Omnitrophota bacterium]